MASDEGSHSLGEEPDRDPTRLGRPWVCSRVTSSRSLYAASVSCCSKNRPRVTSRSEIWLGGPILRIILRRSARPGTGAADCVPAGTNPRYLDLTDLIFSWLERPGHRAVASTVTMLELLAQPYRDSGREPRRCRPALDRAGTADWAAKIRAFQRLRTPDALQAACALRAGATGLITNHWAFERVDGFETLLWISFARTKRLAAQRGLWYAVIVQKEIKDRRGVSIRAWPWRPIQKSR